MLKILLNYAIQYFIKLSSRNIPHNNCIIHGLTYFIIHFYFCLDPFVIIHKLE